MTRATTHWSATGDLHTGAVDGCERCEEGGDVWVEAPSDVVYRDAYEWQTWRPSDDLRAERARANGGNAPTRPVAAPGGDLRGAAVREDVSDRDRPAERRTAIPGGYLCRHGLYRHEHWCDDHDDHAQEGEK